MAKVIHHGRFIAIVADEDVRLGTGRLANPPLLFVATTHPETKVEHIIPTPWPLLDLLTPREEVQAFTRMLKEQRADRPRGKR